MSGHERYTGLGMEIEYPDTVACEDGAVTTPVAMDYGSIPAGSMLLVKLQDEPTDAVDPDFEAGDPTQNIVAISSDCRVEWLVDPLDYSGTDPPVHNRVVPFDGRIVTVTTDDRCCELDPESGAIVDTWPADTVQYGDAHTQLDDVIATAEVIDRAETVVFRTDAGTVYAFGFDGTKRWQRSDPYSYWLAPGVGDDNEIGLAAEPSRTNRIRVLVDLDTGTVSDVDYGDLDDDFHPEPDGKR